MMEINHKDLKWAVKKMYETKTPLFIWGATGIGKSRAIKEVAEEIAKQKGLEFRENEFGENIFTLIDFRLAEMKDPSDLKGLPYPNKERTKTEWLPLGTIPDCGQGILFFDEMNLALPIIQSACYEIILDRKIGGRKIPDGFLCIGAGNRAEDGAMVYDMARPLANRFAHITLKIPSLKDWIDWAVDNDIDSRIISFLNFKPSYLYKYDESIDEQAFATPRSWEMCSKLIQNEQDSNKIKILSSMCIGDGIGYEFTSFINLSKNIDIEDILKNPDSINNIDDISVKYSLIGAITEYYKNNMKKDKNNEKLLGVLGVCNKLEPEFAVLLFRMLKQMTGKTSLQNKLFGLEEYRNLAKKFGKYIL